MGTSSKREPAHHGVGETALILSAEQPRPRLGPGVLIVSAAVLLLTMTQLSTHALGEPAPGCGAERSASLVDLQDVFSKRDRQVAKVWGRDNVQALPPDGTTGPISRVAYPQGSIDPGTTSAPRGGAGFELRRAQGADSGCLRYRLRFPPEFQFVKGGKLPGLYGGDAPRGCTPAELSRGFSARLMWRDGGAGELYLYAPGRSTQCGESIERGAWTFERGAWISIAEQVVMNNPGVADGIVRIWVNGRMVVEQKDLILRTDRDVGVDGLLFSTFFGGHDRSWASPVQQYADFADVSLSLAGSGR